MRWFLTERLLWLYIICKLCSYKHQIYTGNKEDFVTTNKENVIKIIKVTTSSWLPSSSNGKTNKSLCTFCQGKNSENLVITGSFHSRVEHKLKISSLPTVQQGSTTTLLCACVSVCVWKGGGGGERQGNQGLRLPVPATCTYTSWLPHFPILFLSPVNQETQTKPNHLTVQFLGISFF